MDPLRVLHLAPPPAAASGIADYAGRFRSRLAAAGADVNLLSFAAEPTARAVRRHSRIALAAATQVDIVHAELGAGAVGEFYAALALARHAATPVAVTLHEAPRPIWWPFYLKTIRRFAATRLAARVLLAPAARRIEKDLLNGCSSIFALSASGVAAIREVFPQTAGALALLPWPMRSPTEEPVRVAPNAEPIVGYFGYWYPSKGVEHLVAALAALAAEGAPLKARFWQPPPGHASARRYVKRIEAQIATSGLQDVIEMRDALPERQILGALSMCDAIVLPYTEARSTANLRSTSASLMDVLEAGAPAVATRTRSMADFVEDGVNGLLVPAGDVPALTAALRRLRDEPQLAGRLRVGAQAARQNLAEAGDPGRAALSCYLRHLADVDRRA